jgi:hypothetical protein
LRMIQLRASMFRGVLILVTLIANIKL